jgi:CHAP domain-containing protein
MDGFLHPSGCFLGGVVGSGMLQRGREEHIMPDSEIEPLYATADPSIDRLLIAAVEFAATQVGVMEVPPGSNRGPVVDEYIRAVGLDPTSRYPWCAAFVYFCFERAAGTLGIANPVIRTGSVLGHWKKAAERNITRILQRKALRTPGLLRPGLIFVLSTGGGLGHMGLVEQVETGRVITIEGNTNDGGSREGVGVFRRSRTIAGINCGFIDYGG